MKNRNYKARLKARLLKGDTITPMIALKDWGCFRLSVYVNRLRNDGYKIKTEIVRTHDGTQYAKYSLPI